MIRVSVPGRTALSLLLFYLGWWACALGAKHGMPWLGPALIPAIVGLHLWFCPVRAGEFRFVLILAFAGFLVDTALIKLGLFKINGGETWAPQWLLAMWILLGITFEGMLGMRRRLWLLLMVGGLTGPLTYVWCEGVDLLRYARPLWLTIPAHAVMWAAITPLIFRLRDLCLEHALSRIMGNVPARPAAWLEPSLESDQMPAEWLEPESRHTPSVPPTLH
jgi:hypothetical protein